MKMVHCKYRKIFLVVIFIKLVTIFIIFSDLPSMLYIKKVTRIQFYLEKTPPPTEEEIIQGIKYKYPNIPFDYLEKVKDVNLLKKNDSCAFYPDLWQLDLENVYWQKFINRNMSMNLYSAYYDCRPIETTPVVRILGMSRMTRYFPPTYCQIWFNDKNEPIIVPASFRVLWSWSLDMDVEYSHMLSCFLPKDLKDVIPQTVSLVEKECDKARNNMRVVYKPLKPNETQQEFAICLKFLNFPYVDRSPHLVEWFELMKLLGVTKIGVYKYMSHENIEKVLQYYNNTGFVEYTPLSPGSGYSVDGGFAFLQYKKKLIDQMMNELIPYNDCFYKNMYKFKHIALVDSDEVIMPQQDLTTWHDLIEKLESQKEKNCDAYASYCFLNGYFPIYPNEQRYSDEVPEYLHMLQHVKRIKQLLGVGIATKCIHNTKYTWAMHNHLPFEYKNSCWPRTADPSIGIMNHYRQPDNGEKLTDINIVDTSVWRYKHELVKNSEASLRLVFEGEHPYKKTYSIKHLLILFIIFSVVFSSCFYLISCITSKKDVNSNYIKLSPLDA